MSGTLGKSTLSMALRSKPCKLRNQETEPKEMDSVVPGLPGNLSFLKQYGFLEVTE